MKKYLITLLSGMFLFLLFIAGFNWLVDPFDFLNSPIIKGFNEHKPKIKHRVTKVYKTRQIEPTTIILGSSRSLNIPIEHESYTNFPVYNLALHSGSGYEMYRMFQQAHATKPLKTVIMGLDEGFSDATYSNFNEDRFLVDKEGNLNIKRFFQYWRDVYNSLLSIDAIRASISTIKKQSRLSATNYKQLERKSRIYNAGGHHQMFVGLETQFLENITDINKCSIDSPLPNDYLIKDNIIRLHYFREMLETVYQDDIDLKIFFSPVHARMQEIYCIDDAAQSLEKFKYSIVSLVESVAKKHNKKPLLVLDFSVYSTITTEALPDLGDRNTIMEWYWEGSHYSTATAKIMLKKMLDGNQNLKFKDFGIRLNKSNIIEHFIKQRKLRKKYQNTHIKDIDEIHSIAKKIIRIN